MWLLTELVRQIMKNSVLYYETIDWQYNTKRSALNRINYSVLLLVLVNRQQLIFDTGCQPRASRKCCWIGSSSYEMMMQMKRMFVR